MEEWEHHVREQGQVVYCGANLGFFEWAFTDRDHAMEAVTEGWRLQPCPTCLAAMGDGQ